MYAKDGWFWVGISEYTVCLNNAHTIGLKSVKTNSETVETEPAPNDNGFATPGFITQLLGKKWCRAHRFSFGTYVLYSWCESSFCKEQHSSDSHKLSISKSKQFIEWFGNERKYKSDECFENFAEPSSPTISSYENLLKTPTPPEVTMIPEDIRQIWSIYNSNLVSLVAVRAVPPSKVFLPRMEDRRCKMPVTKKTGEEMIVDPSSRYGNWTEWDESKPGLTWFLTSPTSSPFWKTNSC